MMRPLRNCDLKIIAAKKIAKYLLLSRGGGKFDLTIPLVVGLDFFSIY
jgi:uncharacterized linocin/CFP29 family protein